MFVVVVFVCFCFVNYKLSFVHSFIRMLSGLGRLKKRKKGACLFQPWVLAGYDVKTEIGKKKKEKKADDG